MNDQKIRAAEAYLCHGWSHRKIQKNILGIDAPVRGGGYKAMSILHGLGITEKYKGILGGRGLDRSIFSEVWNIGKYLEIVDSEDPTETLRKVKEKDKKENCPIAEAFVNRKLEILDDISKKFDFKYDFTISSLSDLRWILLLR